MKSVFLALILAFAAHAASAEPTRVMVRAQALDAKFIGNHMGGVQVILRDAKSRAVLARGVTAGGTGDTRILMSTPHTRGAAVAGGDTAGFEAVLDITRPTLVEVEASGPMAKPAARITVVSRQWIIPGHDVVGDGWILVFPGLVVEPAVAPAPGGRLKVTAKVTLMCGCPIEPGGIWDAANYSVEADLLRGARIVTHARLAYAGQASQFDGVLPDVPPGAYVLRVVAADAKTPNAGVVEQKVVIPSSRQGQR